MIKIKILKNRGSEIELLVEDSILVHDLKKYLMDGFPENRQLKKAKLIYDGQILKNSAPISSLANGESIDLILHIPGSADRPETPQVKGNLYYDGEHWYRVTKPEEKTFMQELALTIKRSFSLEKLLSIFVQTFILFLFLREHLSNIQIFGVSLLLLCMHGVQSGLLRLPAGHNLFPVFSGQGLEEWQLIKFFKSFLLSFLTIDNVDNNQQL